MIRSLSKFATLCLELISTVCNLVISFGCQPQPRTNIRPNVLASRSDTNGATRNGVCQNEKLLSSPSSLLSSSSSSSSSSLSKSLPPTQPPPSFSSLSFPIDSSDITNGFKPNTFSPTKCNSTNYKEFVKPNSISQKSQANYYGHLNGHNKNEQLDNDDIAHYPHLSNNFLVRPEVPFLMKISNYFTHGTLLVFGYLNDLLRRWGFLITWEKIEHDREGYNLLYSNFANFYIRNIIQRLIDMWCHPICSVPGAVIEILERTYGPYNSSWKFTGRKLKAVNMGSYNYLGFAENTGSRMEDVIHSMQTYGIGLCTVPNELGTFDKFRALEQQVANFLGVEDSVVIGMGFATNSLGLPCLFGPGCLVVSDQCNHASLVLGCKLSGAKIKVFKHNDMAHLETILRTSIVEGQPNGEPWRKVIILVEGIYSMEGTIVNLPQVIRLKRRYKSYLYMDEAHSIGAMGPRGRGICDYYGCNPKEVDILMGTFTKSFAAAGGYIAGSKAIINYIRSHSPSFFYASTMGVPIVEQISCILKEFLQMDKNNNHVNERYYENYFHAAKKDEENPSKPNELPLMDNTSFDYKSSNKEDGVRKVNNFHNVQSRIIQLRKNTRYFRQRLKDLGFHVDGHSDSPVVPIMVYSPTMLKCLISELLKRGVASTGAAFPVTSLIGIRARFCLSAAHTDEMIEYTLKCLDEIGGKIGIKFDKAKTIEATKQQQQRLDIDSS